MIRKYSQTDCAELARLFYDTVHTVNARSYIVVKEQQVERRGNYLTNSVMEKRK